MTRDDGTFPTLNIIQNPEKSSFCLSGLVGLHIRLVETTS